MRRNFKIFNIFLLSIVLVFLGKNAEAAYDLVSQQNISAGVTKNEYKISGDGNHYANVLVCDLTNPYIKLDVIAGAGNYTEKATVTQMAQRTGASAVVNGDFFNMALQGTPNGPSIIDGDIQSSPCVIQGVYSVGIDQNNTGHIIPVGFGGYLGAPSGRLYPIDGLNKSYYWYEPNLDYSHENKLQIYTDFWTSPSRGWDRSSEILINSDGIVEQISYGKNFNFAVPTGKKIIQAHGLAEDFIKENLWIGAQVTLNYNLTPETDWKFLIGGHALLVDNGETVPYTKDLGSLEGNRARTAVGISQDGKTMYIASIEGRTSRSQGMRLAQLSRFMKAVGSFKAVNLDGGGSTAMVVNNDGELNRVVNPENNGYERRVVNGIGVFSTATSGELSSFDINGPDTLVVGEVAYFGPGYGWDGNGNTVSTEGLVINVKDFDESFGSWEGNYLTAKKPGETVVNMSTEAGLVSSKNIRILDSSHIAEIAVNMSNRRAEAGEDISTSLIAKLKDGKIVELIPNVAKWSLEGLEGKVSDDNRNVSVSGFSGNRTGKLKVDLEGIGTTETIYDKSTNIVEMHIGDKNYKANETSMTMDTMPIISNGRTMVPVRFLVEALGGEVEWDESTMTVLIDYAGTNIEVPIGKNTININGVDKPIDSPAFLQDRRTMIPIRAVVEALNMEIEYRGLDQRITIIDQNPIIDKISKIRMNIGSNVYYLDGDQKEMDVEPFTINWRTMVPVRFVAESMNGNVEWNGDNQTVKIMIDGKNIEIPIGSSTINVNGEEIAVDSPAILRDSRSFLPIRAIAESLGMRVGYRPTDQRVTIVKDIKK